MPEIKQKTENDPEKETKKLIEAHVLVLKDKLGRAPTTEEIADALKGDKNFDGQAVTETAPVTESTTEPKILKLKIYYGQSAKKTDKGEVKSPDPNKILFYEGHDGKTYDCGSQQWLNERPSVLDHLPNRPLLFDSKNADIVQAMLNGVIDDEDFGELDKSGALNENTKKIYELQKKAASIQQQLEKSEPIVTDNDDEEPETEEKKGDGEFVSEEYLSKVKVNTGTDVVKHYMDVAGVQQGLDQVREEYGEQGADLFAQILQAALADVDEKTRMLVREEMDECLAPVLDAIEALAAHIGVELDLNEPAPEYLESTEENELNYNNGTDTIEGMDDGDSP